ncbi:hypothetical protein HANVADRAFT_51239 [Hanseniaspora valbyensis NRRL Y-1626]|uniref:Actin-like ATPase domain-containing protein n=1 Tax=Hanseniaspora valbyensis NRRL Y-1626 TaxID=766949 RepID=A0A1B7TJ72_9ASCO|nr:hypothetical protein HANVADRAFT_51239 [Hanseniaspora valbyensis NRRL Y-1626]
MSFGTSHAIFIKLGSYNTIVDIIPYNVYILGNGATSGNSNISIDNYYSNESNLYFSSRIYGNQLNTDNSFSLEQNDTFPTEIQDFIKKDKIVNWEHFKNFINLILQKIYEKIKEESTISNVSIFVVSSLNTTCLNQIFDLLMENPNVNQVRFIPIYLSLLYNYPMGNYLQHQNQSVGLSIGGPDALSIEDSYNVSGSLGKLYQDYILNNDLSSSTAALPNQIINLNVTTNSILLQNVSYLSSFQTNTGFQGNSLIIDIGYKESKIYFVEFFKNLREFETTLPIGCLDIIKDIKKNVENGNGSDINALLENGWVDFQLNETLSSGINKSLPGNFDDGDSNGNEELEELDVAKILASGEVNIPSREDANNTKPETVGKVVNYNISEFDAITKLVKAIYKISTLQTSNKFSNVLSFSKMLENIVIAGSISHNKSFKDSLIQLMKYEFQAEKEKTSIPNVNPFYYSIKYVHSAAYFPNWKEENAQQLAITPRSHNNNTFDSEIKGALIVSRYGFDQLISYPRSQYNTSYNYPIFDGIINLPRTTNL